MSKHAFSVAERFGVWEAHDGLCFWCGHPLEFRHTTVDHVLPEMLENDLPKLAEIRTSFGLPDAFSINDFGNWVPAHQSCNSRKSKTVFAASPVMIAALEYASRRSKRAKKVAQRIVSDRKKGKILASLADASSEGLISREDIESLFFGMVDSTKAARPVRLHVSSHWVVVKKEGGILYVRNGNAIGYTTASKNPDSSFICPHCGNLGPWNGAICMSCNRMSDPSD